MTKSIFHIDVGSTVTEARALAIEGGRIVQLERVSCPTPPPASKDERTLGLGEVLDVIGSRMSEDKSSYENEGVMVTLSAGGEPKAVCAGVVKGISGESAKRAALLAGATVTDLVCVDDGRQDFERISDLRRQDVSVAVMAGGVDEEIMESGTHQILNIARVLAKGLPKKGWSDDRIPLVYAGSQEAREEVARILGDIEIIWADNVRAKLEEEHLASARDAVVGSFSENVRSDPKFQGLGKLGLPEVFPSGYAAGLAFEGLYEETGENVLGLSLDGDAVQVFSGIKGVFTRTVTPVAKVNPNKVAKWLPHPQMAENLGDFIGNLVLRPHVLPTTWNELSVFLAVWKEAIREGIAEHKATAIELRGVHRQRQVGETFQVEVSGGDTLLKMPTLRRIVVTGVLSRVLSREAVLSLVMDGAQVAGGVGVYLDTCNALQVAGLLPSGSANILESLLPLAVLVAPGEDRDRVGAGWASARLDGTYEQLPVNMGEITLVPIANGSAVEITLDPSRQEDLGEGPGRKTVWDLPPGFSRIYVDGRPRPQLRTLERISPREIIGWYRNLGVFPEQVLSGWERGRGQ